MELSILNQAGKETGKKIALNDAIFAIEPNDHAIYLDVKQFLAAQRQGTAKAKQRSENAHSTRKLGRQKGGGGAASPLFRFALNKMSCSYWTLSTSTHRRPKLWLRFSTTSK